MYITNHDECGSCGRTPGSALTGSAPPEPTECSYARTLGVIPHGSCSQRHRNCISCDCFVTAPVICSLMTSAGHLWTLRTSVFSLCKVKFVIYCLFLCSRVLFLPSHLHFTCCLLLSPLHKNNLSCFWFYSFLLPVLDFS